MNLVLLPGLNGTGELFGGFFSALGRQLSCRVVEYPNDKPKNYQELERLVHGSLPVGEQFILLGESFSGLIAISVAAQKPAGLVGLILCCTFAVNPRPLLSSFSWLPALLPRKLIPNTLTARALLGQNYGTSIGDAVVKAVHNVPPAIVSARLREITKVNVTRQLAEIDVPIFSLAATNDWLVPRTATAQMLHSNPSIESVQIKGTHFLLQTNPIEVARVVKAFIHRMSTRTELK
jgi:pimeloyl-ACP methyl ester carboxylesterase